jgi:hypothetical protein
MRPKKAHLQPTPITGLSLAVVPSGRDVVSVDPTPKGEDAEEVGVVMRVVRRWEALRSVLVARAPMSVLGNDNGSSFLACALTSPPWECSLRLATTTTPHSPMRATTSLPRERSPCSAATTAPSYERTNFSTAGALPALGSDDGSLTSPPTRSVDLGRSVDLELRRLETTWRRRRLRWRRLERRWKQAWTFGSLLKILHFCITREGEPKIDHTYEASVRKGICQLQCVFKTHFGIWDTIGDSLMDHCYHIAFSMTYYSLNSPVISENIFFCTMFVKPIEALLLHI